MSIFRHVTSVFHWKIFTTVFLCFIAGECHGSVNILSLRASGIPYLGYPYLLIYTLAWCVVSMTLFKTYNVGILYFENSRNNFMLSVFQITSLSVNSGLDSEDIYFWLCTTVFQKHLVFFSRKRQDRRQRVQKQRVGV